MANCPKKACFNLILRVLRIVYHSAAVRNNSLKNEINKKITPQEGYRQYDISDSQ